MIPKCIHYIWLSGEDKPNIYKECIDSWHRMMPDYEVKEWSLKNLPEEVLSHSFVKSAIEARKWAYAADYIRLWALYTYGGIYMDADVYVFKKFDPFLKHSAFSCFEFYPEIFYEYVRKKKVDHVYGLSIEAAIMGAVAGHKWIKTIMGYYDGLMFINTPKFCKKVIMPLVVTEKSIEFGFKYVPVYQVLKEDVHIYPADVFSSCLDLTGLTGYKDFKDLGECNVRYAYHACAHSWYEKSKDGLVFKVKEIVINIFGKKVTDFLKSICSNERNIIYRK